MAATSSAVPASEAQRLMMMSVDKIVASRNRRGGVSLHRNLLVAGVLFRARDALLAAQKFGSTVSASTTSGTATSGTPSSTRSAENATLTGQKSSSLSSSTTSTSKSTAQSSEGNGSRSTSDETTRQQDSGVANDEMHVDVSDSKENVPPVSSVQSSSSSVKVDSLKTCAESDPPARRSRKRSHSVSSSSPTTADHVDRKLVKTDESVEQETNTQKQSRSLTLPARQQTVNAAHFPVVYVNRVEINAAVTCRTTIGSTLSPHCGTSSGLGVIDVSPVYVVQVV